MPFKFRITGLDSQFIGELPSKEDLEFFLERFSFMVAFPRAFTYDQIKKFSLFAEENSREDAGNAYDNLSALWNWSYLWDKHLRMNRKNQVYFSRKKRKNIGSGNFNFVESKGRGSFVNWNRQVWKQIFRSYLCIGILSREKSLKILFKWIKRDLSDLDSVEWGEDAKVFLNEDDLQEAISLGVIKEEFAIRFQGVIDIPPGKYLIAKVNWHRALFSGELKELTFCVEEAEKSVLMRCSPHIFCASNAYLKKKLKVGYFLWKLWRLVQKKVDFEISS